MYLPDTPKLCVLKMQLYEAEVKDEGDLLIPGCPSPWQCQILPIFWFLGLSPHNEDPASSVAFPRFSLD